MSCDWDVYCKTCKSHCGIPDANHRLEEMRMLIKHRHAVASLVVLKDELQFGWLDFEVCGRSIDIAWFALHCDHELVPMDEYGYEDGACEKWTEGPGGHSSHSRRCTLRENREGPCK